MAANTRPSEYMSAISFTCTHMDNVACEDDVNAWTNMDNARANSAHSIKSSRARHCWVGQKWGCPKKIWRTRTCVDVCIDRCTDLCVATCIDISTLRLMAKAFGISTLRRVRLHSVGVWIVECIQGRALQTSRLFYLAISQDLRRRIQFGVRAGIGIGAELGLVHRILEFGLVIEPHDAIDHRLQTYLYIHHDTIYRPWYYIYTMILYIHHDTIYIPWYYIYTMMLYIDHDTIYIPW